MQEVTANFSMIELVAHRIMTGTVRVQLYVGPIQPSMEDRPTQKMAV